METEKAKELKRVQKENEPLRRAETDLTLDKLIADMVELTRHHGRYS